VGVGGGMGCTCVTCVRSALSSPSDSASLNTVALQAGGMWGGRKGGPSSLVGRSASIHTQPSTSWEKNCARCNAPHDVSMLTRWTTTCNGIRT
jgi:hypothetical protein